MTTFQRELLSNCYQEAKPLLLKHWEEIAHYPDIPLNPDEEKYYEIERTGFLRVYTARTESKKLIGYSVFFVNRSPHYQQSVQAHQDVLYVDPNFRGVGGRFINWCDEQLRLEGVQVVYHHLKVKHNFSKLLERFGYELVDLIYGKRLDK